MGHVITKKLTLAKLRKAADVTAPEVHATLECTLGGSCRSGSTLEGVGATVEEALLKLKEEVDAEEWLEVMEKDGMEIHHACPDCIASFKADVADGWENVDIPIGKDLQVRTVDYNGQPGDKTKKLTLLGKRQGNRVYAVGRCWLGLMGQGFEAVAMGVFDVVKVKKESTLKKVDLWVSTEKDAVARLKGHGLRNSQKFVTEAIHAHKQAYWQGT